MRRLWKLFLAYFRLSAAAVCEMSAGYGPLDFHDFHDTAEGRPEHFTLLRCARCGKEFLI